MAVAVIFNTLIWSFSSLVFCLIHFSAYSGWILSIWNHPKFSVIYHESYVLKRLVQGHLHPKLEVKRLTCSGRESNPGLHGITMGGEHSRKEQFEQLVNSIFTWNALFFKHIFSLYALWIKNQLNKIRSFNQWLNKFLAQCSERTKYKFRFLANFNIFFS